MKTNFKKVIALLSIAWLVVLNSSWVNAWALNWVTTSYDDANDTITVNATKDFTTDNVSVWSVKQSNWTAVANWDSTEVTENVNNFVITSASFDGLVKWIYSVSFSTVNWDFGAWVVYVDNWNVVNVSAVVLPILSMELSTNSLDFGELAIWDNNQSLNVITKSNAEDGIVVSMDSLWLATWNSSDDYYIWNLARGSSVTTTWTDSYLVSSSTLWGWSVLTETNVASTQNVLSTIGVADSNTTTTVNLKAVIDAQTEAWNYNDTLTFTVTWTY